MIRRTIYTIVSTTTPPPQSATDTNARQMASAASQTANNAQQAAQQAETAAAAATAAAQAASSSATQSAATAQSAASTAQQMASNAAEVAAEAARVANIAAANANTAVQEASGALSHASSVQTQLQAQLATMSAEVQSLSTKPAATNGKSPEMRVTGSAIQWRQEGGSWSDLIALTALKGADGQPGTANLAMRMAGATVNAILLGGSADVTVTWPTPMPTADYQLMIAAQSGLLGRANITVKSKSQQGAVLTVASTSLAISAGSVLVALALSY